MLLIFETRESTYIREKLKRYMNVIILSSRYFGSRELAFEIEARTRDGQILVIQPKPEKSKQRKML